MGDVPQTATLIASALSQDFRPKIVRTVNRRSVALRALTVETGGGKNVYWDWEGSGQIGESFSDGADAANFGSDSLNAAVLPWARYRSNFRVTGDAEDIAASSTSPQEALDLLARNMMNGFRVLAKTMNPDIFSGSAGGNTMVGLDTALRNDNTYAGVDRTQVANAGFRGNLIDPGSSTDITIDDVRRDIGDTIYTAAEDEGPDLAFMKPNLFYQLASKWDPNRRYNSDVSVNLNSGRQVVLDGSIGAIQIEGCTFIKEQDATANRIYYINSAYVRVMLLKRAPLRNLPSPLEMGERSIDMNDGGGQLPYQVRIRELANQGDSRRLTMITKPCLLVEKPSACGLRLNVAATS